MISLVKGLEDMVNQLDTYIDLCPMYEINSEGLSEIRKNMLNFVEGVKNSISFKLEMFGVYGIPLEDEDLEDVDTELLSELQREIDLLGFKGGIQNYGTDIER